MISPMAPLSDKPPVAPEVSMKAEWFKFGTHPQAQTYKGNAVNSANPGRLFPCSAPKRMAWPDVAVIAAPHCPHLGSKMSLLNRIARRRDLHRKVHVHALEYGQFPQVVQLRELPGPQDHMNFSQGPTNLHLR